MYQEELVNQDGQEPRGVSARGTSFTRKAFRRESLDVRRA